MEMGKVWEVLTECGICFALPQKAITRWKYAILYTVIKGEEKKKNETKLA